MNTSLQLSLPIVFAMLCALVAGNYMVNSKQGMSSRDNLRDTQMWGVGFFIYAMFDFLILML